MHNHECNANGVLVNNHLHQILEKQMPFASTTETAPHTIISFPVTGVVCVTSATRNAHCLGKACLGKIIDYLLNQRPLLFQHNRQRREQFCSSFKKESCLRLARQLMRSRQHSGGEVTCVIGVGTHLPSEFCSVDIFSL